MPKITNMPDMGDIDIPDDKPTKKGQMMGNMVGLSDIENQLNALFGGQAMPMDDDEEDTKETITTLESNLGLTDATVEQIVSDFVKQNGGSLASVPLETIVQHFMIELQKYGIVTSLAGDPSEKDSIADLLSVYLDEKGIMYPDGGDGNYVSNIIVLLQNNGRTVNQNMTLTEAEFYGDQISTIIERKFGGDSDEIFEEVYDAILESDGTHVNDLDCGEKGTDLINDLVSVHDAIASAAKTIMNVATQQQPQTAPQQPAAQPSSVQQPQAQQAPVSGLSDESAVREIIDMANGGSTGDPLSESDIQRIMRSFTAQDLDQMAEDYNNGDDWRDGGILYEKVLSMVNAIHGIQPQNPASQQAQAGPKPSPAPAKPKAPDLLSYNDPKRITHIAGFMCKTDQDIENELMGALGNPSKDKDSAYPSLGLEQLQCDNSDEVDFGSLIADFQRFYVADNTDKLVLCRTVSDDVDNVGFDFAVYRGMDDKLHVYVPLMYNTIRQDGKAIKISDYVPDGILNTPSEEEDTDMSSLSKVLSFGGSPFGGQQSAPKTMDEIRKENISRYHKSAIAKYDQRKTESYCNLAVKEKTFVSMCLKEFGDLEKKAENKQYLHGFIYVGDITPKADDIDSKYFISDHELDATKKKYEFYVKVSSNELSPDDLAMLKPIVGGIDYSSDPISNIDLESDGDIVFITIPIVYYLKK